MVLESAFHYLFCLKSSFQLVTFCHATRMHSADYAVVRCLSVCLSVRPSVCHTPVLSLNGYTYPQSFFSPSGSPTILVFPHQTGCQYSDEDPPPPNGGVGCKGVWKKSRFSINIWLCLGTDARQSHSYYGKRIGNCTHFHFQLSNGTSLNDLE